MVDEFEPKHQNYSLASDKDTSSQTLTTKGRKEKVLPNHQHFNSLALFHTIFSYLMCKRLQKEEEKSNKRYKLSNIFPNKKLAK